MPSLPGITSALRLSESQPESSFEEQRKAANELMKQSEEFDSRLKDRIKEESDEGHEHSGEILSPERADEVRANVDKFESTKVLSPQAHDAVIEYQHDFSHIQSYLAHGDMEAAESYGFDEEEINELSDHLSDAISSFKSKSDLTLYRSIRPDYGSEEIEKNSADFVKSFLDASPGDIMENKAFSSTSMDKNWLGDGSKPGETNEVGITIKLKKGQSALPINKIPDATKDELGVEEVLLNKGSKFKVEKVDKEKRRVELSLMNEDE
jgi:hypothetical protein